MVPFSLSPLNEVHCLFGIDCDGQFVPSVNGQAEVGICSHLLASSDIFGQHVSFAEWFGPP